MLASARLARQSAVPEPGGRAREPGVARSTWCGGGARIRKGKQRDNCTSCGQRQRRARRRGGVGVGWARRKRPGPMPHRARPQGRAGKTTGVILVAAYLVKSRKFDSLEARLLSPPSRKAASQQKHIKAGQRGREGGGVGGGRAEKKKRGGRHPPPLSSVNKGFAQRRRSGRAGGQKQRSGRWPAVRCGAAHVRAPAVVGKGRSWDGGGRRRGGRRGVGGAGGGGGGGREGWGGGYPVDHEGEADRRCGAAVDAGGRDDRGVPALEHPPRGTAQGGGGARQHVRGARAHAAGPVRRLRQPRPRPRHPRRHLPLREAPARARPGPASLSLAELAKLGHRTACVHCLFPASTCGRDLWPFCSARAVNSVPRRLWKSLLLLPLP